MKNFIITAIFFFIVSALSINYLEENKKDKTNLILDQQIKTLETYYNLFTNNQIENANNAYIEFIQNKYLLHLLKKVNNDIDNNELKNQTRNIMYKELLIKYELLRSKGLLQYQIILPNNNSYLRMFKPNLFSDDIYYNRADIEEVNKNKVIVRGFSESKLSHGFRHLYPLFYDDGTYLGVLEISFSSDYLQNTLNNISQIHSHFLVKKDLLKDSINTSNFTDSEENNSYLLFISQQHNNKICVEDNNLLLKEYKKNIKEKMDIGKPFAFYVQKYYSKDTKIISFFPIKHNMNGDTAAWIVSYTENQLLNNTLEYNYTFILLILFILFILSSILYFLLDSKSNMENVIKDKTDSIVNINNELIEKDKELIILNKNLEEKVIKQNAEQQMLLSLFDKGHAVVFKWVNNKDWDVEYVSKGVNDLLEYSSYDFYKKYISFKDCIHPDDFNRVKKEVFEYKDGEYIKHKPYRIVTESGVIKWVSDFTLIIRDNDNEIKYFLGYLNDITEEIKRDQLLFQKSKLASLGEMIGNIAHQWRQPLSLITTSASGIKLQNELNIYDFKNLNDDLSNIISSAQYLSQTIDDFRDFIKGESKKETFGLSEFIQDFLDLVNSSIKINHINVLMELDNSINIYGSKNELHQCLLNLFNNSKDVIMEEQIRLIGIKTYKNEKYSFIEFYDNGRGINNNVINKIFEPYFTTKHKSIGTGLGLSMTYQIIHQSFDGEIYVENSSLDYKDKKYVGAKFIIKIPINNI